MNIFILNTGRCGSTTFIKACEHLTNYTAAHESLSGFTGEQRLAYPDNHIEADNRLSWFLGRLDSKYADSAFYVHLSRDLNLTAASFARRMDFGIIKAYKQGILLGADQELSAEEIALDYIQTVDANIRHFLKNKTNKMNFSLDSAKLDFKLFCKRINAQGDVQKALMEWDINYNSSQA